MYTNPESWGNFWGDFGGVHEGGLPGTAMVGSAASIQLYEERWVTSVMEEAVATDDPKAWGCERGMVAMAFDDFKAARGSQVGMFWDCEEEVRTRFRGQV